MITPSNAFAPILKINDGTQTLTVLKGTLYYQGTAVTIAETNVALTANTTNNVYLDLGTRAIAVNTTTFPSNVLPIATVVTGAVPIILTMTDVRPDSLYNGKEFLGFSVMSLGSTLSFPARDWIECDLRVRFYGVADIISLQFNGDTGNNYVSRAVKMATGGTTWANTIDLNTTNMIRCASTGITGNRSIKFAFGNRASNTKVVIFETGSTTGAVGTGIDIDAVRGEWFNTTAQVTSITINTAGGNTVGADLAVYGKNFS